MSEWTKVKALPEVVRTVGQGVAVALRRDLPPALVFPVALAEGTPVEPIKVVDHLNTHATDTL